MRPPLLAFLSGSWSTDAGTRIGRLRSVHRRESRLAVAPWRHNPSSWKQRVPLCLLALVAAGIAGSLALFQWGVFDSVWDPVFGRQSERVLRSRVAERMDRWLGIPDAALGALAYLSDAVFGLAGSVRRWYCRPWLVILFGIDVIPLGLVSVVLVVAQGVAVGSWCFLCLVTAVISLALVVLAVDEVWSSSLYLIRVGRQSGRARVVWDALWGKRTAAGERVSREMLGGSS